MSQSSLASTVPLPHCTQPVVTSAHVAEQLSWPPVKPAVTQVLVPSSSRSHASPLSSTLSPQLEMQSELQPSPSMRLPSSHSSSTVTMPLPQPVSVQFESQPSSSMTLPSSQSSPAVRMLLPQPVGVQFESQFVASSTLPSSQSSSTSDYTVCRRVSVQFESQPSSSIRLPCRRTPLCRARCRCRSRHGAVRVALVAVDVVAVVAGFARVSVAVAAHGGPDGPPPSPTLGPRRPGDLRRPRSFAAVRGDAAYSAAPFVRPTAVPATGNRVVAAAGNEQAAMIADVKCSTHTTS